jgi:rsbT antagonist protein RsbS
MSSNSRSGIPLQLSQECVVASIQVDLDEDVLQGFRKELLELLQRSGARGIILDLSGVSIIDGEDFRALRDTMDMARLMGAVTVMSGLQAGVVSALIDLEADTRGVEATLTLDDAYARMAAIRMERVGLDEDPSTESELEEALPDVEALETEEDE